MRRNAGAEFDELLNHLRELPPEDQRFLSRLMTELSRRAVAEGGGTADETILEVTRDIAPERVPWVAGRLGYG